MRDYSEDFVAVPRNTLLEVIPILEKVQAFFDIAVSSNVHATSTTAHLSHLIRSLERSERNERAVLLRVVSMEDSDESQQEATNADR